MLTSRCSFARAWLLTLCAALTLAVACPSRASAHASLMRAEPADGAVLAEPPARLTLTFNEPITPLIMRLIGPSGETVTPALAAANATVTLTPPQPLQRGSYVLSWRVVSADGHPVGGAVLFSIGAPSAAMPNGMTARAGPGDVVQGDTTVAALIWLIRLALYIGLFVGIGGTVFAALMAKTRPLPGRTERWIADALGVGLFAAVFSVGLQGLDALALPFADLWQAPVWAAGLAEIGMSVLIASSALLLAALALRARPDGPRLHLARGLAVAALLGAGAALALTGHAGSAAPRLLARASVLLHAVCVAFWIGALVPLWMLLRAEAGAVELARFSRVAPLALLLLIATGVILAALQLDRLDALWTTRYGLVLGGKIVGVTALLGLAGVNRLLLAPKFFAHAPAAPAARRRLAAALAVETAVAMAIFGVVALWRFTPPPRALAAAFEHVSIHFHGQRAMAQIEMEPRRARGAAVEIQILDGEFRPLPAKEVTLVLSNRAAGIEPMRRAAAGQGDGHWHVDDLPIPLAGRWRLRVEILVGDFDKVTLEDDVLLPRSP